MPPLQPGAELFQSPMTAEVRMDISQVHQTIHAVLDALRIPFYFKANKHKYKAFACFVSGFARFSVLVWSRKDEHTFAVEIIRERGDRMLTLRVFERLAIALQDNVHISNYLDFDEYMFDWQRPKLSASLATVPPPKSSCNGIVDMLRSGFDDIALNGAMGVVRLLTDIHPSSELLSALRDVVVSEDMSWETRTNAALALQRLSPSHLVGVPQPTYDSYETRIYRELITAH